MSFFLARGDDDTDSFGCFVFFVLRSQVDGAEGWWLVFMRGLRQQAVRPRVPVWLETLGSGLQAVVHVYCFPSGEGCRTRLCQHVAVTPAPRSSHHPHCLRG